MERSEDAIILRTSWDRQATDLGFVVLEPGDRWKEYFFADRWYNIFEIRASGGPLKGWYCNIARAARIESGEVTAEDLALDLWVEPDGTMQVLDEDEFAQLPLSSGARRSARQALAQLRTMVERGIPPFERGVNRG
ncbi:MAG: DUF402 domain-containing protein [Anaerolineae bacterium]